MTLLVTGVSCIVVAGCGGTDPLLTCQLSHARVFGHTLLLGDTQGSLGFVWFPLEPILTLLPQRCSWLDAVTVTDVF
jgi:hypothetical protein